MAKTATLADETAPAVNDAYTGMLAISLIALVIGCILLFLDLNQYEWSKNPPKASSPPVVTPK